MSSSAFSTVTASLVQLSSAGALGTMINQLRTREIDVFASAYFTTRSFAVGHERGAHEEEIYSQKRNNIRSKFEVTRSFDLVHQVFLTIDLPGLANAKADGTVAARDGSAAAGEAPYYTDNAAAALVRECHICFGGHSLSKLSGTAIALYEELAGQPGKRLLEMVHKAPNGDVAELQRRSSRTQRLYLPMYWWFCSVRGSVSSALNLIGAQFQRCTIDVNLNSLASVVHNCHLAGAISAPAAGFQTYVADAVSTNPMTERLRDGGVIETAAANMTILSSSYSGNARCTIDVLGITLNEQDRNTFATTDRMVLMDEIHEVSFKDSNAIAADTLTTVDLTEHAKNLVYNITLAARSQKDGQGNSHGPMRFEGITDASNDLVYEALSTIDLRISGQQRTTENLESQFYNMVTPYQSHSTLPSMGSIYALPFALYPQDYTVPSSTANVSKLDSMNLRFRTAATNTATDGDNKVEVTILCHALNILIEQKGMKARYFV